MKVIAAPGLQVPKENDPRTYVTDAESVTVPDTLYYRRRISDGDLIEVVEEAAAAPVTQ